MPALALAGENQPLQLVAVAAKFQQLEEAF